MIKFFVTPEQIAGGNIYIEDRDDVKHLVKVLRAKVGDEIAISDGDEWEYVTEIEEIGADEVKLRITDKQKFAREPSVQVSLYQGIPKAQKMESIIQKCVELGVSEIIPVFTERTVVVDKGQMGKKTARWQKISDEAVKQCKRGKIPKVREPLTFEEMADELAAGVAGTAGAKGGQKKFDIVICPYENEEDRSIKDALRGAGQTPPPRFARHLPFRGGERQEAGVELAPAGALEPLSIAVIIGPEGGFADEEVARLAEDDIAAEIVTLGKTILRTETAGMAAIAMVMYELEL